MKLLQLLLMVFQLAGLAGCSRFPDQKMIEEEPSAPEKCCHFEDPGGLFSIQIPPHLINPSIREGGEGDFRYVNFIDDYGQLIRIEAIKCKDEDLCKILLETHYKDFFRELFEEGMLNPILRYFPGTEVLYEEDICSEDFHEGYYVLLSIPGGATTMEEETGKHLDALRGFLFSFADNHIVVISNQYPPLIQLLFGDLNMKKVCAHMLDELCEARKLYVNKRSVVLY